MHLLQSCAPFYGVWWLTWRYIQLHVWYCVFFYILYEIMSWIRIEMYFSRLINSYFAQKECKSSKRTSWITYNLRVANWQSYRHALSTQPSYNLKHLLLAPAFELLIKTYDPSLQLVFSHRIHRHEQSMELNTVKSEFHILKYCLHSLELWLNNFRWVSGSNPTISRVFLQNVLWKIITEFINLTKVLFLSFSYCFYYLLSFNARKSKFLKFLQAFLRPK